MSLGPGGYRLLPRIWRHGPAHLSGCVWDNIVGFSGALARIEGDDIAFGVLDDERQNPGPDCQPLGFVTTSQVMKR
jgi:hypothetical protein